MAEHFFILYVDDQDAAKDFYAAVLQAEPQLHVPGMTEFALCGACSLGLMPAAGIKRLLGPVLPDPAAGAGLPRAELYLSSTDAAERHARALAAGARELQAMTSMPWGQRVAYSLDPDGHVLACAEPAA